MSDEPRYRDRCREYVPDDFRPYNARTMIKKPGPVEELVTYGYGKADELNRDTHGSWDWVQVEDDPAHFSHFNGHHVLVDFQIKSENYRDVNDWKGRDEIRASVEWSVSFNRIEVLEGHHRDPFEAIMTARQRAQALLHSHIVNEWSREGLDELEGREIKYHGQPAKILRAYMPRIVIVGDPSPIRMPYQTEEEFHSDDPEHVTHLDDPHIWWWRK